VTEIPQGDTPPLSSRVRRGALWSVASTLLMRVLNIVVTAVVAHILDPHDFGVFAVALTAYAIVSSIGQLGVASCIIRADLDLDTIAPTAVTVSLATSIVLAGAMVVFARPIAAALGSAAGAGPVRVMSLAVLFAGAFAVPCNQIVRDFKLDRQFLANVISFVPGTAVLLILAKSGSGAMAFAWSRAFGQLIEGCVLFASLSKNYWPGFNVSALRPLFKFGIPLAAANFVNYVLLNVDYALVGHLLGAIELGVYVLAFNVSSWSASLLGNVINTVSMPAFSRIKDDAHLLRDAIASSLRAVSLIVMPICAMTMALARPLVLTLYGDKWGAAASVLSVLSIYGAISIACVLFANILAGLGRSSVLLMIQLAWIAALFPAMAIGVHWHGIVGAAFAHIAVIGPVVLPIYLFVVRKVTGVHFVALARAILPALLASSSAALAAHAVAGQFAQPLVQLVAGLATGGVIYVIVAAPQAMVLFSRGRATNRHVARILRQYNMVARLVGLTVGSGPKHSVKGVKRGVQQELSHATREPSVAMQSPALASPTPDAEAAESSAIGLELLMSLAKAQRRTRSDTDVMERVPAFPVVR
jgi:lipopolysaccharide exporter